MSSLVFTVRKMKNNLRTQINKRNKEKSSQARQTRQVEAPLTTVRMTTIPDNIAPPLPPPEPPPSPPPFNRVANAILLLWALRGEFSLTPPFNFLLEGAPFSRKRHLWSFSFIFLLTLWSQTGSLFPLLGVKDEIAPSPLLIPVRCGGFFIRSEILYSQGAFLDREDDGGKGREELGQNWIKAMGYNWLMGQRAIGLKIVLIFKERSLLEQREGRVLSCWRAQSTRIHHAIGKSSSNSNYNFHASHMICLVSISDRGRLCRLQNNLVEVLTISRRVEDKTPFGQTKLLSFKSAREPYNRTSLIRRDVVYTTVLLRCNFSIKLFRVNSFKVAKPNSLDLRRIWIAEASLHDAIEDLIWLMKRINTAYLPITLQRQDNLFRSNASSIREPTKSNPLALFIAESYKSIQSRLGRERSLVPPSFKERVSPPSTSEKLHMSFTVLLFEVLLRLKDASRTALVKSNGMYSLPNSHHKVMFPKLAVEVSLLKHLANVLSNLYALFNNDAHHEMSDDAQLSVII